MIIDLPFKERSVITKIQEKNFSQTMDLCFSRHPYYRARFKQMGLLRGDIKSLADIHLLPCLLYTSPSPRDGIGSRMPSSA